MSVPFLGLDPQDVAMLLAILNRSVPQAEIWAFGSRVSGKARPFSDLDIVILQDKPMNRRTATELNGALSESRLPVKVDVVEWGKISPDFRKIVRKNHVVLKPKRKI
jgi:predicted nucleotidyltransferase